MLQMNGFSVSTTMIYIIGSFIVAFNVQKERTPNTMIGVEICMEQR